MFAPNDAARCEEPAERLWQLWRQGRRPEVNAYLAELHGLSPAQLAGVLRVDQRERWQIGERVLAETYLQQFPAVQANAEHAVDLIYNEFLLREKQGDQPTVQEYLGRFPDYAEVLKSQIELHLAMAAEAEPDSCIGTWSGGQASAEIDEPAVWPEVPGYEILGELGRGGMGVVYQARQVSLNRMVALKMILAGAYADPEQQRRFRTEAEAIARLRHPNVVQVHDYGVSDGRVYLALEYVEGGTLAQKAAGVAQPPKPAAHIIETLAVAVHHAHRQGLVHRDLKPANILLTSDGVLKITDFGLAKHLSSSGAATAAQQTASGALLGTPTYMAPEQVTAERGTIGPATDVYALGVILYELLTGQPPFQGDSALQVLRQVQEQEPRPPRRLRPGVPHDLETICLKCLEKTPGRRYASAAELAEDLRRFQAGEPILARPIGKLKRVWRWGRRNPKVAGLTALAGILLVVIAVGSMAAALRLRQSAGERLWEAKLAEARMYRYSDQPGRRSKALEALAEAARIRPTAELRDEAIAALHLLDLRLVKELPGGIFNGVIDSHFERNACSVLQTGAISIRSVKNHGEIYHLPGFASRCFLRLSDDGRFLATGADPEGQLKVWELAGEEPRVVIADEVSSNIDEAIDFSPDNLQLAVGRTEGIVRLYDLASGKVTKEIKVGTYAHHVAFHPTRRQIAISCDWGIQVRDIDTGKMLAALEQEGGTFWLAWHPGGNILAAVRKDIEINLWDVNARRPFKTLAGHRSGGVRATFNRSGDLLVSNAWDGTLRFWDPRSGQLLFNGRLGLSRYSRFGPGDRLLGPFFDSGKQHLAEVSRSPVYGTFMHSLVRGLRNLAMAAGGPASRRLVAVGRDDGVSLWDLEGSREVGFLSIGLTERLVFDSTGALLTNGPSGVRRWPVAEEAPTPFAGGEPCFVSTGRLRIGPPELLAAAGSDCQIACSNDGRVIAVARYDGGLVFRADRGWDPIKLSPHEDTRYIAVSPDGDWVATGAHNGNKVKIWESSGGEPVKELEIDSSGVGFSPDGKWFLTTGGGNRLWRVGSWEEVRELGGDGVWTGFAFSPDGKVLAASNWGGTIHLLEVETGREFGQLQYAESSRISSITFNPVGTKLLAVNEGYLEVRSWDLRALGRELAEIGLGWDLPLPPSGEPDKPTATPLNVTVLLGDPKEDGQRQLAASDRAIADQPRNADAYWQRGRIYADLGRNDEAVQDFSKAIAIRKSPKYFSSRAQTYISVKDYSKAAADYQAALDAKPRDEQEEGRLCDSLARLYACGPAEVRSPAKALPLASRAVRIVPKQANYLNTLGVVYYRLGQYDQAVESLQRSLKESEHPARDLFFLALSFQRLGDATRAKDFYDQAEYWCDTHLEMLESRLREDLIAIRAEASAAFAR